MNVVFDTNVLIAAFLSEGVCAKLLLRARKKQFQLVVCPFVLQEFERVLSKKFAAAHSEVREALELVDEAAALKVQPVKEVAGVCRDEDDDNVLACAQAAKADYLVTGDADLLVLESFEKTRIITPRVFELLFED
ncbi:MAG: PilT protein domain-containing [Geobacteraceae bacterium]|nr:MAG: PilT protein domain-containing [Geobacteraceae bacterium]